MAEKQIGTLQVSGSGPIPGNTWRCCKTDIDTNAAPPNTHTIRWDVDPTDPNWQQVSFDIANDVSHGKDPTLWTNQFSGNRTKWQANQRLYVGNVQHATGIDFNLTAFAIYD